LRIVVIGSGYVGLVSGTCFAEMGHSVVCLDVDEKKIALLKNGLVPIYEPGLQELIAKNSSRLKFTTSYEEALKKAEVAFIAVPTQSMEDGSCDLRHLYSATKSIAAHMSGDLLVVNKSTVPPGTAKEVYAILEDELKRLKKPYSFSVISNPEFLKEGSAIHDCMKPDRIIIGSDSEKATETIKKLYAPFCFNHDRILVMSTLSAELTKYAANVMLASRISLMNELSRICDSVGANIHDIRIGIGSDRRIGYDFLYAGAGYGGSCFPKDIRALKHLADNLSVKTPMLSAIELVNEEQKKRMAEKIKAHFGPDLAGKQIGIWGLSFKPDTDDIRDAPAIELIEELLRQKASVKLFDPISMSKLKAIFAPSDSIAYAASEYDAAAGSDAIALVTEWKQFRFVDLDEVGRSMKNKVFFDGRNQYKPELLNRYGFTYYGMGVNAVCSKPTEN
jgi:UDPglucose 6-dehydrogenase